MPEMSGSELAEKIRQSDTEIPIILSTGQLAIDDIRKYTDLGISGFIHKPWTAGELIQCIQGTYDEQF
jgi:CheY-like chemotaxis protein